jgi:argininosuccinate synthase
MPAKTDKDIKRVVLAYSGGLDTSIILKWLQETYACEVVTFTADLGQGEELEPARQKALMLGIKPEHIFIEDLREEFVRDYREGALRRKLTPACESASVSRPRAQEAN